MGLAAKLALPTFTDFQGFPGQMRTPASGTSGRLCILQSVCRVKSLAGQRILSTPEPGFAQFARSQCLQLERQDPIGTLHRVKTMASALTVVTQPLQTHVSRHTRAATGQTVLT